MIPSTLILLLSILSLLVVTTQAAWLDTAKKAVADENRNEFDFFYALMCDGMVKANWDPTIVNWFAPSMADRTAIMTNYASRSVVRVISSGQSPSDRMEEQKRIKRILLGAFLRTYDLFKANPVAILIPIGGIYLSYKGTMLNIFIIKKIVTLLIYLTFLLFKGVRFGATGVIGVAMSAIAATKRS